MVKRITQRSEFLTNSGYPTVPLLVTRMKHVNLGLTIKNDDSSVHSSWGNENAGLPDHLHRE